MADQVSSAVVALPYTQNYRKIGVQAQTEAGSTFFLLSGLLNENQGLFATKISIMVAVQTADGQTGVYREWSFSLEEGSTDIPVECDDQNPCTIDEKVGDECKNTPKDCSDAYECTEDFCNETNGECTNEPKTGTCLIGGTCYASEAKNPENSCRLCNPDLDPLDWSAAHERTRL